MFFNKLKVEVEIKGEVRTLLTPLEYYSKRVDEKIIVPKGFETNYGSIPRAFRNIIENDGLGTYGYVVHDYLYGTQKFEKNLCDLILKDSLIELGFSKTMANIVYYALLIGGHKAYKG